MGKEEELIRRMTGNLKIGTNSCVNVKVDTLPERKGKPIHKQELKTYIERGKQIIDKLEGTMPENAPKEDNYEMVNHPQHYNNYDVEVVDMMEKIWGTKATMEWCKMTAYKYRMRMGTKPAEDDTREAMQKKLMEDFNKEQWYLAKAKELSSKLLDKSIDMDN